MGAGTVTGMVLVKPKILIGGYDVSGYHDRIVANISKEMLMAQQFGATGKMRKSGLWDLDMSHSGFWDGGAATIDAVLRGLPASNVLTLCPEQGLTGESSAWFCPVMTPKYSTGGKVGGLTTFEGTTQLQDGSPVLNGKILKAGDITTTGTGTAYELGAVSSTQFMYAAMHVTGTTGASNRTLDVIIQSGDDETMVGATTRMTFTQVTTSIIAEYLTPVAAEVTQTWWRASWTRGGTSGTFAVTIVFAIL